MRFISLGCILLGVATSAIAQVPTTYKEALGTRGFRTALCAIDDEDRQPCAFAPRGRGSFTIITRSGDTYALDIVRTGVGRGNYLGSGKPHFLGAMFRDQAEPACWNGEDTKICVW